MVLESRDTTIIRLQGLGCTWTGSSPNCALVGSGGCSRAAATTMGCCAFPCHPCLALPVSGVAATVCPCRKGQPDLASPAISRLQFVSLQLWWVTRPCRTCTYLTLAWIFSFYSQIAASTGDIIWEASRDHRLGDMGGGMGGRVLLVSDRLDE